MKRAISPCACLTTTIAENVHEAVSFFNLAISSVQCAETLALIAVGRLKQLSNR
jgi:hypothetical protein